MTVHCCLLGSPCSSSIGVWKTLTLANSERALRESSLFSTPASSAAGYAEQIEQLSDEGAQQVRSTVVHLSTSHAGCRRTPSTPNVNVVRLNASGNGAAKRPTELRIADRVAELTSSSTHLVSSFSMMSSSRPLTARNAGGYPKCCWILDSVCVRTANENSNLCTKFSQFVWIRLTR